MRALGLLELTAGVKALLVEQIVGLDNAPVLQPLLPLRLIAPLSKLDVSLPVRAASQRPSLRVPASKATTPPASDMLVLTEFVKAMPVLPTAEHEFAPTLLLQATLMHFALLTELVALRTEKAASHQEEPAPATQVPLPHVLDSLALMDSAKVLMPPLLPLVHLRYALKLPPPQTLMLLVLHIKLVAKLPERDVLPL